MKIKIAAYLLIFTTVFFVCGQAQSAWKSTYTAPAGVDKIFLDMDYFDNLTGYAVGFSNVHPYSGFAYKTMDGGNNWSAVHFEGTNAFLSVALISSETAVIATACLDLPSSAKLYKTVVNTVTEMNDFSANFAGLWGVNYTANTLFVVGQPKTPGDPKNFTRSADEGKSWNPVLVGTKEVSLSAVSFVDANVGWVGGFNGTTSKMVIYKTTNEGSSWTNQYEREHANTTVNIFALDAENVFAVGGKGCLISENGGELWRETSLYDTYLYAIKAINKDIIWLTAPAAQTDPSYTGIYRSVDGGRNWKQQLAGLAVYSMCIEQNPTRLYASGVNTLYNWVPPQITSFSTKEIKQGTIETVSIIGTDFEKGSRNEQPTLTFSKHGISVAAIDVVSSTEISATLNILSTAEIGAVDVTFVNIDTTTSTSLSAFSIITGDATASTESMKIESIYPTSAFVSEEVYAAINGSKMIVPLGGTVEVSFGDGIEVSQVSHINNQKIAAHLKVLSTAAAGTRNVTLTIKSVFGETISSETKTAAFRVKAIPDPGTLPESTDIIPVTDASGVWNPEKDGDLPVQVKVPVPGAYKVMVATPSGIKFAETKNLNVGYNKIMIPASLELPNGTHMMMIQDPKTGKLVKAKIVVIH